MHSPLTSYTVPTSKFNNIGSRSVDRLIIHHTAGGTNASNVALLSAAAREVSASYCLLTDGQLVGIVPEEYRPWTSNAPGYDNDRNAVTVETVNTAGAPSWTVSAAQLETLAQLAADLSTRYGWGSLDRRRVLGHREVVPRGHTECPGPSLYPALDWIVTRANTILAGDSAAPDPIREEYIMSTIYVQATGNSSPLDPKNPNTARIWAGDDRRYDGTLYSGVWAVDTATGTARRLTMAEWRAVQGAFTAADRPLPLAAISGDDVEVLVYAPKAAGSR